MATMSDAKQAWDEVGSKFSVLGQHLKQHLEQERKDAEGGEDSEKGEQAKRDIKAALERLTDSLDDAFEALGNAAKDPTVRHEVSDAGRSLVSAVGTSLEQLGDEMRRYMDRKKRGAEETGGTEAGSTPSEPGDTSPPTGDTTPPAGGGTIPPGGQPIA
jgi:hypothetical protein